jgi:hypothetical protein
LLEKRRPEDFNSCRVDLSWQMRLLPKGLKNQRLNWSINQKEIYFEGKDIQEKKIWILLLLTNIQRIIRGTDKEIYKETTFLRYQKIIFQERSTLFT